MSPPAWILAAALLFLADAVPSQRLERRIFKGSNVFSIDQNARWTLSNARGFANVSLDDVQVPSYALQTLHERGVIGDPLFRYNERELRWVAEDTWTYSAVFTPPPPLLVAPRLQLTLRGVDTAADVSLNGKLLGSVANAHRRHSFDVSRMLVDVDNRLVLTIRPAAAFSQAQAAAYPYDVPATTQVGSFGRYNFVRKAASDFGWDWGPTFAAAGVSAGVELAALEGALLADVALRQRHHPNGSVTLTADLYLQPGAAQERGRATLAVAAPGGRPLAAAADLEISPLEAELLAQGRWTCGAGVESCGSGGGGSCGAGARPVGTPGWVKRSVSVRLSPPLELWWPWQYGAAALHNVSVTYASDGGGNEQAVQRRVGLRVVELLRLPAGPAAAPGQSFAFRVNGLPLWARGANVVPLDVLETRVSDAQLRRLVRDAQAANMNFLRVWGGGRYAGAAFYDACDEAGVLVWQELMYACAMYPRDASFVVEAQEEARQQALRLGWHASVALWGGNNENEAALAWFPAAAAHRELYAVDQAHLFATKLRDAVLAVDPGAIYLDTSPSNGLVSADPYVKHYGSVDDPTRGDVHYYNYEANLLEQGIYPPARFVSEFGFQSLPSLEAYRGVTEPQDWSWDSPMMHFRLRHAGGLQQISDQLAMHFSPGPADSAAAAATEGGASAAKPPGRSRRSLAVAMKQYLAQYLGPFPPPAYGGGSAEASADAPPANHQSELAVDAFRGFIYLSQVQQALIYEAAAQRWRRPAPPAPPGGAGPLDGGAGRRRTMGLLYWQLNDIWQGPSWSGINFGGQWKPLHHAAARFFAPLAVWGVVDADAADAQGAGGGSGRLVVTAYVANDLSVDVEGDLEVELVPFGATAAQVQRLPAQRVRAPAFEGAALPVRFDPAAMSGADVEGLRRQLFMRLRFCPTAAFSAGHHSPLFPGGGGAAAAAPPPAAGGCDAPGAPAGASPAECAAARRLLRCSESVLLLAELKDADVAPAQVRVAAVRAAAAQGGAAEPDFGEAGGGAALEIELRSDGVAFFVLLESPRPGVFSDNAFVLLPWEPRTITFTPRGAPAAAGADAEEEPAGCGSSEVDLEAFRKTLSVTWMQGVLPPAPAPAPAPAAASAAAARRLAACFSIAAGAAALL